MKTYLVISFLICLASVHANPEDSVAYNLYKDKVVLYNDLGYNSAPFSIKDDFVGGIKKLNYKHNQKIVLGFGVAYKWFAFRIGFALPGTLRSVSKYGDPNYLDLGVKFNIKKTYWDLDFRNYKGYSIKDAYRWDDSLSTDTPNAIEPNIRASSFSINSWYFNSDDFKMQSVLGKVGDFKRSVGTLYLKGTLSLFGIGNDAGGTLVPEKLIDTTQTKSFADGTSVLDLGLIPGYAYVLRKGFWQASAFAGLGAVVQSKFYTAKNVSRGFLGIAARVDFRFNVGYSKPGYFFWLTTDFDFKSISFQEMKFSQGYHSLRLVGGMRLNKKQKEKKKKPRWL